VNKLIEELKMMSILDPLTGLSNRRYFTREFADELARIGRNNTPLALIFLDLDHFKKVNDTHGHRMGDEILRLTASHLRTHCRPYDIPARWGGEEFIILLPDSTEKMAAAFAERLRLDFTGKMSPKVPITVTVSIGVTGFQPGDTLENFVDRADKALYHAKRTGRNKVVSWSDIAPGSGSTPSDNT
jgi:diguanylate cyclase (GGDEF)-like protein